MQWEFGRENSPFEQGKLPPFGKDNSLLVPSRGWGATTVVTGKEERT